MSVVRKCRSRLCQEIRNIHCLEDLLRPAGRAQNNTVWKLGQTCARVSGQARAMSWSQVALVRTKEGHGAAGKRELVSALTDNIAMDSVESVVDTWKT